MAISIAIETKYLGSTGLRAARIKATYKDPVPFGFRVYTATVSYDHGIDSAENHREAVQALLYKYPETIFKNCAIREMIPFNHGYIAVVSNT